MKVSALVVSYNVSALLRRCIQSLLDSADAEVQVEVIVVDNASDDDSVQVVRDSFPQVQLLDWSVNRGFAAAVNAAAKVATGDYFFLLNPDAALPGGALQKLLGRLNGNAETVAVGARQVDQGGFFQLAMGPKPSLIGELGRKLLQKRLDKRDEKVANWLERRLSNTKNVAWVAGSSLLVRREAFEGIGGFDEEFFLFFEDIDFCLRLQQAGGRVVYDPTVTVTHERGESAATDRGLAEAAYRRSQLYFWEKHKGPWARRAVELYQLLRRRHP